MLETSAGFFWLILSFPSPFHSKSTIGREFLLPFFLLLYVPVKLTRMSIWQRNSRAHKIHILILFWPASEQHPIVYKISTKYWKVMF